MLRSMFTAISALSAHKDYMDVVSDNLANANTTAFKASRSKFQSQHTELVTPGSAPSDESGGVNPSQIGLGTRMSAVTPSFTQGSLEGTGRNTDMAIQGNGFFIYRNGDEQYYSRDGATQVDADGYLVNESNGFRLQGWLASDSGSGLTIDSSQPVEDIQLPLNTSQARATTTATMGGNLNSEAAIGESYDVTFGIYDSLGAVQDVTVTFTRTSDTEWDWAASGDSGTIVFDSDGQYTSGSGSVTIPGTNGAAATTFNLDMESVTQLSKSSDATAQYQDGLAAGGFTSFKISNPNGKVYGIYTNGEQQLVGQVALSSFVNPVGLKRTNQNMFEDGLNSGEPSIGIANTGGRGSVNSGYLESSNVDLAREFTNMIVAQRGFQASSRVISTSDEMLQELVNIKR